MKTSFVKRILAISVSFTLLFSLTACNRSNDSDPKSPAIDAEGTSTDNNKNDPFGAYDETLVFTASRYVQPSPNLPEGDTYEDNAYTRYLLKRINAKMKNGFEASGEAYDQQISLAIASGEMPDIMSVTSRSAFLELVENDMVADLTEAYEKFASPGLRSRYDSFNGRAISKATIDGKMMGLPGTPGSDAPAIVWIREDWLTALDMDIDTDGDEVISLAELEMVIKMFKEKDPGQSGDPVGFALDASLFADHYGGAFNALPVASVYEAYPKLWMADKDGKPTYGSIEPQAKEMLKNLNEWYENGLLDNQVGLRTWEDLTALLINNQMGVVSGAWHIPDWLLASVREMDPNAMFKAYAVGDDDGRVNVFRTDNINNYVVVRKGFSNPELLIKIANIYYDELLNGEIDDADVLRYQELGVDNSTRPILLEIGIEGGMVKNYENIRAYVLDGADISVVESAGEQTIAELAKQFMDNPEEADTTMWARYHSRMRGVENIKKMYDGNKFDWAEPVFWGTTPTMEKRMANLLTMEQETYIKIITGELPLDAFDTFVSDWRSEGGDMILEEIAEELEKTK